MKEKELIRILLATTLAAACIPDWIHTQTPVLQDLIAQTAPEGQYRVPVETIRWLATEGVSIRIDYLPRDGAFWAVIDFEQVKIGRLSSLGAGLFYQETRLPTDTKPRLELRLSDHGVRLALDPLQSNTLLLLRPEEYRGRLEKEMSEKRWGEALSTLDELVRLEPESLVMSPPEINELRMRCLKGQVDELAEQVRFEKGRPSDYQTRLRLANAHLATGDFEQSRLVLQQLKALRPTDWEIYYYLGLGYLQELDYPKAIEEFLRSVEVAEMSRPKGTIDPKLYCFLGRCYYEQYKDDKSPSRTEGLRTSKGYLEHFLGSAPPDDQDRKIALDILARVEAELSGSPQRAAAADAEALPPPIPSPPSEEMRVSIHLRPPLKAIESFGGEVVVVHIWATFCGPCRKELPELAEFFRSRLPGLSPRGLKMITVSNDFRSKDFLDYAQELGLDFPIYWDARRDLQRHFGIDEALPATLFLGRDGRKLDAVMGSIDWMSPALLDRIEEYLGSK